MATYEMNDDSVVAVIGSGAGGGTLANELCQKGVPVVLLEAGKRESRATFVNDEWASFGQLAWTDKRTTSGTWRVARDFPNLPAWTCKAVGGTTRPVGGGASDGLAGPGREIREVSRHAPGSGGGALVRPGELPERGPLVVHERGPRFTLARLQQHHRDALLAQLVRQGAAPGAASDDGYHGVVAHFVGCHVRFSWDQAPGRARGGLALAGGSGSHLRSLKPRCR